MLFEQAKGKLRQLMIYSQAGTAAYSLQGLSPKNRNAAINRYILTGCIKTTLPFTGKGRVAKSTFNNR